MLATLGRAKAQPLQLFCQDTGWLRQPGGTGSNPTGERQDEVGKFLVKPVLWFRYTGAIKRKTDLS
jgi:hypothetical protein